MSLAPWVPPLVKAVATATLVVGASVLAQAVGPFWAALVASLPVSAGPAFAFLALEHGGAFVARAALAGLAANAATALFLMAYAATVVRLPPWPAVAAALAVWFAAGLTTLAVPWTPLSALALNLVVYVLGFRLHPLGAAGPPAARAPLVWRELLARALAIGGFVTLLVAASRALGPAATGLAALFPVTFLSLFVVIRPRLGAAATAAVAASALRPMLGFGVMLLVLHLAVPPLGVGLALGVALVVPAAWSLGLLALRRR